MSDPNNNDPEIDSVEQFEDKVPEPISNDTKQPPYPSNILAVNDEFVNEKSSGLVKYFHSAIKQHLTDPTKQYLLLENTNMNKQRWQVIWANEPTLEGEILVYEKDSKEFQFRGTKDTTLPKPIFPIDALASDYKTDDDGTQHFPTECLKLNNDNYWISDRELHLIDTRVRKIVFTFPKKQHIKYFGINFYKPDEIKQQFDVSFMTDQYDRRTGDRSEIPAFKGVTNLMTEGIQLLEFKNPIITDAIALTYTSRIGAINYVCVIENQMSDEQLEMFLSVNSQNSDYNKAFKSKETKE